MLQLTSRRLGLLSMVADVGGVASSAPARGAGAPTLSLVIPAYNEEARLPALLNVLATSADTAIASGGFRLLETLIVDDGSTDRTPDILAGAESIQPKLKSVLGAEENQGKGAAVAAGVDRAQGEYVLLADVDLSTPLEELHVLTDAVRAGADIAVGSRAVAGAIVERGPAHRKLLGKTFNATVRILTGLDIKDTQCGFKLLPTEAAKRLLADQECPGFAFDVELLMRADLADLRIAEVPVTYVHDSRSSVKVGSASFQMLRDVSRLAYGLRRRGSARAASWPLGPGSLVDFPADDSD